MSPPTRDQWIAAFEAAYHEELAERRRTGEYTRHVWEVAADAVLALLAEHPDEGTLMTRRIRSYLASTVEGAPLRVVLEDILEARGE